MMVNVVWRRSSRDKQVHAFVVAQIAEPGRSYLEALCRHAAPHAALEPTRHRPGQDTCMHCLLSVGGRLADAGGDPGRHGTPPP